MVSWQNTSLTQVHFRILEMRLKIDVCINVKYEILVPFTFR